MQHTQTSPSPIPLCALVVGVGELEGIGGAVAVRFAQEGIHVYVVGRTAAKLESVVAHIRRQGGVATAVLNHLGSEADIKELFSLIQHSGQQLTAVVFNAAFLNVPQRFMKTSQRFIENNWRLTCLAGILVGQYAARHMLPNGLGTVIFTGATASLRGKPLFAAFASAKSALRAFAHCLALEVLPQGIHVVHVVIDGVVEGRRAKGAFGGLGRIMIGIVKRRNGTLEPTHIANNYWQIHQQPSGAWSHELELRPFKEPF